MHVILDTNVIFAEGFGTSVLFRFFTSAASSLGHEIHVPALVIDEAARKFEEEIAKRQSQTNSALELLETYLRKSLDMTKVALDTQEEVRDFRVVLEGFNSVLDYPDTPHKELAKRAIHRKKPFDNKGSGYRDSLIWESVVELASAVEGQVVLLTKDKNFSEENGNLAEELNAELVQKGLGDNKVALVSSAVNVQNH